MIVVDTGWSGFRYRVAYFPTGELARLLIGEMGSNELLRLRQMRSDFDDMPTLLYRSSFKAICVDLTEDLETLRGRMDDTCRRWLRKAERLAGEVEIRRNDAEAERDFVLLYNRFAALSGHSGPLTSARLRRFAGRSDLFGLYYRNRLVCGHLWLRDPVADRVRLMFSASSRLEGRREADLSGALNRYLHWREIQLFKNERFAIYDLGGFEADEDIEDSLTRYKLSLGGSIVRENNYWFGRGIARLAFSLYAAMPQLNSLLRGRLPA